MTSRTRHAGPLRAVAALAAAAALGLSTLSLAGPSGQPVYGRVFSHYENLTDPAAAAKDIRAETAFLQRQGIPAELNLIRGELQAAWFRDNAPDVIDALRDPLFELAYHPHPFRPYTDLLDGMKDLPWDQAVAEFTRFESCSVDFTTGAVDCSEPGGAAAVTEIVGRPLTSVCDGGPSAVSTYVFRKVYGIPTQLDSGRAALNGLFGDDAQAYWYMGQLVYKDPPWAQLRWWFDRDAGDALREATTSEPPILTVLASDKLRAPDANEYANEAYIPGVSTITSLRAPLSMRTPDGKYTNILQKFETAVKAVEREASRSGGAMLTATRMLELVYPAAEHLTRAEVSEAAAALSATVRATGSLPAEIPTGGRTISNADLYEALARGLIAWREGGRLPESVATVGLLGPIGDPLLPRDMVGARTPLPAAGVVAAIPVLTDRVPWLLPAAPAGDAPIYASEALVLLSAVWLELDAGRDLDQLARADAPISLEPAGAPTGKGRGGGGASGGPPNADRAPPPQGARGRGRGGGGGGMAMNRWDWYTQLQFWTAKRVRWR